MPFARALCTLCARYARAVFFCALRAQSYKKRAARVNALRAENTLRSAQGEGEPRV